MGALALIYSLSAVLGSLLRRVKLPLLVGFLLSGLILGGVNFGSSVNDWIIRASEFGAAFLMFAVGLELDLKHFKGFRWVLVWMTLLQMAMFAVLSYGMLMIFNYQASSAIIFSMVIAFSSTVLVASVLREKKQQHSLHGRVLIGVLILQDLITIGLLFIIPFLKQEEIGLANLIWKLLINTVVIYVVLSLGRVLFRWLKNVFLNDYDTVFVLAVAYLMSVVFFFQIKLIDLPPEIAGLVAGLSLSKVFERDRIVLWFDPIKDYFLVFLFFYIGWQVDKSWFIKDWQIIISLALMIVFVKSFIGWITSGLAGFPGKVILMTGLGLANMSELGFVILAMSARMGLIEGRDMSVFSLLILITIMLSSVFLYNSDKLLGGMENYFSLLERARVINPKRKMISLEGKKVVIGCHRSGWAMIKTLGKNEDLVVLDFDYTVIRKIRRKGIKAIYCDATDKRSLEEFGLEKASMIISTLPEVKDNLIVAGYLSKESKNRKKVLMVCMGKNKKELVELYEGGVDLVLNPYVSIANEFIELINSKNRSVLKQKYKQRQKIIFG